MEKITRFHLMTDEQLAKAYNDYKYNGHNEESYDEGPHIIDAIFARTGGDIASFKEWIIRNGLAEILCEGVPYAVAL